MCMHKSESLRIFELFLKKHINQTNLLKGHSYKWKDLIRNKNVRRPLDIICKTEVFNGLVLIRKWCDSFLVYYANYSVIISHYLHANHILSKERTRKFISCVMCHRILCTLTLDNIANLLAWVKYKKYECGKQTFHLVHLQHLVSYHKSEMHIMCKNIAYHTTKKDLVNVNGSVNKPFPLK